MKRAALLALYQLGASFFLMVTGLGLAQGLAPSRYTELGIGLPFAVLTLFAVINPVWGVFVRPWWLYTLLSVGVAALLLVVAFPLIDFFGPGTVNSLGPGALAFPLPLLLFALLTPICGLIQLFALRFAR